MCPYFIPQQLLNGYKGKLPRPHLIFLILLQVVEPAYAGFTLAIDVDIHFVKAKVPMLVAAKQQLHNCVGWEAQALEHAL